MNATTNRPALNWNIIPAQNLPELNKLRQDLAIANSIIGATERNRLNRREKGIILSRAQLAAEAKTYSKWVATRDRLALRLKAGK